VSASLLELQRSLPGEEQHEVLGAVGFRGLLVPDDLSGVGLDMGHTNGLQPCLAESSAHGLICGLWLIFLELSIVSFMWFFSFALVLQAIWVAGVGMIVLAFMQRLPAVVVGCSGALILVLHNRLDGIQAGSWGSGALLWELLHQQTIVFSHGRVFAIFYPVLPWIGVICVGYACGPLVLSSPRQRQRRAAALGMLFLCSFTVLRLFNAYGDHNQFRQLATPSQTLMSFLKVEKYLPLCTMSSQRSDCYCCFTRRSISWRHVIGYLGCAVSWGFTGVCLCSSMWFIFT